MSICLWGSFLALDSEDGRAASGLCHWMMNVKMLLTHTWMLARYWDVQGLPGPWRSAKRQSNSCLGPVLLVSLQASSRCQILFKCSWPELCLEVGKEESLVVMLSLEDWQGEPIFLASCYQWIGDTLPSLLNRNTGSQKYSWLCNIPFLDMQKTSLRGSYLMLLLEKRLLLW